MNNVTKGLPARILPLCIFLGMAVIALGLRQAINLASPDVGYHPLVDTWLRIVLILFVGFLAASQAMIKNEKIRLNMAVGLLSLFFAVVVMLVLKNTYYALGGVDGDQGFRTAYITKFANFTGLIDFTYKDLPSFYPPLYYWSLGKLSTILKSSPYVMSKYGLIMTVFILPYATCGLWSMIVGQRKAVAIAFAMILFPEWYKPSGWIALFLFVPWWLYFVVGYSEKSIRRTWWYFIGGGLLGSVIFQLYYYPFFVGGISLFIDYVIKKFWVRQETSPGWKDYKNAILMLVGTAVFSSYYWFPFLRSIFSTGGWEQYQALAYGIENATIPFGFYSFSIPGIISLSGLVYLLISFRSEKLSLNLLVFVLSAYILLILNFVGAVLGKPFLGNAAMKVGSYVLLVSAFILLTTLWQYRFWDRIDKQHGKLVTHVFLILLFVFVGQELVDTLAKSALVEKSLRTEYPELLIDAFSEMSGGDYLGKVILSDNSYQELPAYLPVFEFISWRIHYSHPAGLYRDRLDFLEKLSRVDDPALFAGLLMNNRYSKIDYILLVPEEDTYRLKYSDHILPNDVETKFLNYPKALFDEKYFIQREYRNFVLFIPRYENDPMRHNWQDVNIEDIDLIIDDFSRHLMNNNLDS